MKEIKNKKLRVLVFIILFVQISPIFGQGIFDINNTIRVISKTRLVERDGFGESSYQTKKLPNGNLKVRFTYDKPSVPNPLFITYTYGVEKLPSGDFAVDIQAAMPPLSLYIDTNALELSYTGDKIILPNKFTNNEELPRVSGIVTLKKIATKDTLLTYHVSMTNRKFVKKGNISLNGKSYEAYTHTYDFVQKTFLNGDLPLSETAEIVEETYWVGYGLVNQTRQGSTTLANKEESLVINQTLISEVVKIK